MDYGVWNRSILWDFTFLDIPMQCSWLFTQLSPKLTLNPMFQVLVTSISQMEDFNKIYYRNDNVKVC